MRRKKENENEEKEKAGWMTGKERKGRNELLLLYYNRTRLPRIGTSTVFFASLLLTVSRRSPEYRPELTDDIMV